MKIKQLTSAGPDLVLPGAAFIACWRMDHTQAPPHRQLAMMRAVQPIVAGALPKHCHQHHVYPRRLVAVRLARRCDGMTRVPRFEMSMRGLTFPMV